MAPHDEEDDPAVYRSARSIKTKKPFENGHAHRNASGSSAEDFDNRMQEDEPEPEPEPEPQQEEEEEGEEEEEESDREEEDGTLLTVQPGFNRLLLVLRDEGVMRFVKYVSAAAEGSRWDVCGEFEIGMVEEESEREAAPHGPSAQLDSSHSQSQSVRSFDRQTTWFCSVLPRPLLSKSFSPFHPTLLLTTLLRCPPKLAAMSVLAIAATQTLSCDHHSLEE